MELPDSRAYIRDLSDKEIENLKRKYESHFKKSRVGFLNTAQKEKLLQITKWRGETGREVYDFFYEIRERAKSAIIDMQLLCDVLNEEQLEQIFGSKEEILTKDAKLIGDYLIVNLLKSLIPYSDPFKRRKETDEDRQEKEWRKHFIAELVSEALIWYFFSGIFKTDSHLNLIFDALDTITVMSTGKKRYQRTLEGGISMIDFG